MTSHHTTEQIVTLLKCATEEHAILQIDMQDFDDALYLCGSSPMCFNVTDDDAGVVLIDPALVDLNYSIMSPA